MQKLNIDLGIEEYEICGNLLRINPSDPNLYDRFSEAAKTIARLEEELVAAGNALIHDGAEANGAAMVKLMREADLKVKKTLNEVFGLGNDFDTILRGVNLMAVGTNGERIITNLLAALIPIVEAGAKRFYQEKAGAAVAQAKANRAMRRAAAKAAGKAPAKPAAQKK